MCGRFIIFSEVEEREIQSIIEEVSRKYGENPIKKDEVFPTDYVPVVTSDNGARSVSVFKWGFPSYKGSQMIINARSETIAERPMFKKPFSSHRCLIPTSAFFEWKQIDGKKKKYMIRSSQSNLFYMAGLYYGFKDKNGHPFTGFVVITTSASSKMSLLHDRMPVIFTQKDEIDIWLNHEIKDIARLKSLLKPNDNILITAS